MNLNQLQLPTTYPGLSGASTETLPIRLLTSYMAATVSSEVLSVRMTSHNFMTGTAAVRQSPIPHD